MTDLAAFLTERITEDEELARAADGPDWSGGYERSGEPGNYRGIKAHLVVLKPRGQYDPLSPVTEFLRGENIRNVDHAIWHDPARVLAECEAKRHLIQRSLDLIASFGDWDAATAEQAGGRRLWIDVNRRERSHAHDTLLILAAPYSDHPDFDPSWLS